MGSKLKKVALPLAAVGLMAATGGTAGLGLKGLMTKMATSGVGKGLMANLAAPLTAKGAATYGALGMAGKGLLGSDKQKKLDTSKDDKAAQAAYDYHMMMSKGIMSPEDARKSFASYGSGMKGDYTPGTEMGAGRYEELYPALNYSGLNRYNPNPNPGPMPDKDKLRKYNPYVMAPGMANGGRIGYAEGDIVADDKLTQRLFQEIYGNEEAPDIEASEDMIDFSRKTQELNKQRMEETLRQYQELLQSEEMNMGGRVNKNIGGILKLLAKPAGKALSKIKTKLSRMTDDVEIYGSSDFADDTGSAFSATIVPKTKKGLQELNKLSDEGLITKEADGSFFLGDSANKRMDALEELFPFQGRNLKASGAIDDINEFQNIKQLQEGSSGYGPDYGYDEILEYITRGKKAAGGPVRANYNMGGLGSIPQTEQVPQGMQLEGRGGGFIPMGAKEKHDDVPAMLAKNEFVMTSDAVKAAGGGSVNKGAQVMYDLMNSLESKV